MFFKDREQAAHLIARQLSEFKGKKPLILAIPRGAVPLGKIIADDLKGDLDVVLVHKIGHPDNPEFAMGAVDEAGIVYGMNDPAQKLFAGEINTVYDALKKRRQTYTPLRPPIDPKNRIVIIVDDGIATGCTFIAAIQSVKTLQPKKIVAAFAVAPKNTLEKITTLADQVVCLHDTDNFQSVGEFFRDFSQVSDKEVEEILKTTT